MTPLTNEEKARRKAFYDSRKCEIWGAVLIIIHTIGLIKHGGVFLIADFLHSASIILGIVMIIYAYVIIHRYNKTLKP